MTTRPQLASSPAIAVLTKGELAIERPTRLALSSLAAPLTLTAMNFCAPSPSRTTRCASCRHTSSSAAAKASAPALSNEASGVFPALLVAKASTVSLVEVSESTVMQENVFKFAADSSDCRKPGSIEASVKM